MATESILPKGEIGAQVPFSVLLCPGDSPMCLSSPSSPQARELVLCALLALCSGCGFLTAGATIASGGEDNAQPVASDLSVTRSASSPASIFFRLTDQEGDSADVKIYFKTSTEFLEIALAAGSNPLTDVPGNSGSPYEVSWNFADALGLTYHSDIEIKLEVIGGISPPILTGVDMGNDAPDLNVPNLSGEEEYEANVDMSFTATDTASDLLKIKVEYSNISTPDSWHLARPAGTPSGVATPAYAFEAFESSTNGSGGVFVWDSTYDLPDIETDVRLRFTPEDAFTPGVSTVMEHFRIDNNEAPLVILDEANFVLNPDQRRGIPISFKAYDDESDSVRVLVQWRRRGQAFPTLPTDVNSLVGLLDDSAMSDVARVLQVATQAPISFSGRVGLLTNGVMGNEVRLPELASSAAGLLGHGIAGRTLEILRSSGAPEALSWSLDPALGLVAALPRPDGRTALVLLSAVGDWQVKEIDLASGALIQSGFSVSNGGVPTAMCLDPLEKWLFVTTGSIVYRYSYPGGNPQGAEDHRFSDGPRAIAALGENVVLITGDDALKRVDFQNNLIATLMSDLDRPWGIVVDPLEANGIYLSENLADRVVAINLNDLVPREVPAVVSLGDMPTLGTKAFPSPRALALERSGERLLVMTKLDSSTTGSLRLLHLRSPHDFDGDTVADPFVYQITSGLEKSASLATGPDGLRLLAPASPSSLDQLAAGGGIEQSRKVISAPQAGTSDPEPYDPARQVVTVEENFDPPPGPGALWRIRAPIHTVPSSPEGLASVFVWDSTEVPGGGEIQLRVIPLDTDIGLQGSGSSFKTVLTGIDVEASDFEGALGPFALVDPVFVLPVDLDGDGDLDLVLGVPGGLSTHYQTSQGVFGPANSLKGTTTYLAGPGSAVAVDFDVDGDTEIVAVLRSGLEIFSGDFASGGVMSTTVLGSGAAHSVAAADLNGDGLTVLIAGTDSGLVIFEQDKSGTFTSIPISGSDGAEVPVVADLDGDGDLDLAAVIGGNVEIFAQGLDGTFASLQVLLTRTEYDNFYPTSLLATDLNGDGYSDLVVSNQGIRNSFSGHDLAFWLQDRGPGLPFGTPLFLNDLRIEGCNSVCAADIDCDGDLDLIATDKGNDDIPFGSDGINIIIFPQVSPGEFGSSTIALSELTLGFPGSVTAVDINGSGCLDLIFLKRDSANNPTIFYQAAQGDFKSDVSVAGTGEYRSLVAADLDGDGDLDLATSRGDQISIQFQDPPGQFGSASTIIKNMEMGAPGPIAVADLDGDGDVDLVAGGEGAGVFVFSQLSSGVFEYSATLDLNSGGPAKSISVADLNGDGYLDIVQAVAQEIRILFQDMNGFSSSVNLTHVGGSVGIYLSVAVGDLNADGHLDLVASNSGGGIIIFHNSPTGFNTSEELDFPEPMPVVLADVDGDGLLDIISSEFDGSAIRVFYQDELGEFEPSQVIGYVEGTENIVVTDLDGDGDADVAASTSVLTNLDEGVGILFQSSPRRFRARAGGLLNSPDVIGPGAIIAVDLDGDGETDLATVNTDGFFAQSHNLTIFYAGH